MTYDDYNAFCRALPATSYVINGGDRMCGKSAARFFAIGGWDEKPGFTFKVSDISYELLKDQPGLRPAPYLASTRHEVDPALCRNRDSRTKELRDYIRQSHRIVSLGLTRKKQRELGLNES